MTCGRAVVVLTISFSFSSPLLGQVLPFFTKTAQTVGFESNAFRTFSRALWKNRLEIEGQEVADPEDRDVFVFAQVFAVPIRIDGDTVLAISAPILHKELSFAASPSQAALSDSGLGDTTLLLKRRVYQNDYLGGGIQAAILGGVKLPTGDHDQRDAQGNLLPPGLQLGTGSVDVPIGFTFTAFKNRIGFTSDVLYQFNNQSDGFRFGDETRVNLAVGYRLFPKKYRSFQDKVLNLYLELNTAFSDRASFNGKEVLDSGGTLAFLTPGFQVVLNPRFLFEMAFQIPVFQKLNGTQLAFTATANFGIRVLF